MALKDLYHNVQLRRAQFFNHWKVIIDEMKKRSVMDEVRAQKLRNAMHRIPQNRLKTTFERIIGDGNLVLGRLKRLENMINNKDTQQRLRDAMRMMLINAFNDKFAKNNVLWRWKMANLGARWYTEVNKKARTMAAANAIGIKLEAILKKQ